MNRFVYLLGWVAAIISAVCSCASPAQELSSYWEEYDFESMEAFQDIESAEEMFEGYVSLLGKVPEDVASASINEFLDSAARNQVAYIIWAGWIEAYLHTLESPYNNERLFQICLDKIISDNVLDSYIMERLIRIKKVSGLNIVGNPPSDVMLRNADGNDFMISGLKGEDVLLLLLDGGCKSCLDYLSETYEEYKNTDTRLVVVLLNASPHIISEIVSGLPANISSRWTVSWCPGREIEDGNLYDTTLVPSKLLIDAKGNVVRSYHK